MPFLDDRLVALIPANVRRERRKRGLSQRELAQRCEPWARSIGTLNAWNVSDIAYLETKGRASLTDRDLLVLARGLGCHRRALTRRRTVRKVAQRARRPRTVAATHAPT